MNPSDFEYQTKILHRPETMTAEECGPLPVYSDGKICISLWRMSWRERISSLFFGKVWLWSYSGQTQPPVAMEVTREIFKVDSD